MEYYKYIFVILVYRNTGDLVECLESIKAKVTSFKSVIVNAYYDDRSQKEVERIAGLYQCDFLSIENKGYSYGNNRGIDYVQKSYDYEYIVISNPDIVIDNFEDKFLITDFGYDILAPKIVTVSGKNQNPAVVCRLPLSEYFIYYGYKHGSHFFLFCGIVISKLIREIVLFVRRLLSCHIYSIYIAHGSFLLISRNAVNVLKTVYDENMFLFGEEGVLARRASKAHLKTCYVDYISVTHKEDGSMKLSDLSIDGEMRKANIYFYENYIKKQQK